MIWDLSYIENYDKLDLKIAGISSRHLKKLALLAEKFEQNGAADDDELSLLFQAGSSPGVIMSKMLVENEGVY